MSLDASASFEAMQGKDACKYHPFKDDSQILSFCEIPEIKEIRQKILVSLEQGSSLQVVYGENGIGKTMLARNISLARRLNVQIVKGANGLTVVNLMKKLCSAIKCQQESLTAPPMKHINNFVKEYTAQEKPLCLIIDDANLMPIQTLAAIIHCNNRILQENREDFTIALFGTPDLKDKITPLVTEDDKLDTNIVELTRFSEESIVHYIYTKLRHAGWKGPLPIIPSQDLKNIRSKSGGIPKNINHVIGYHYFDNWVTNWHMGQNKTVFKTDTVNITSVASFLVLGFAIAFMTSNNTELSANSILDTYINTSNTIVAKITNLFSQA